MALTKFSQDWEMHCLSEDPFAGDFEGGGDSDRIMSDKMVTNRNGGECHTCASVCLPGSRNRVRVEVYDGELMRFRRCQSCSRAMAAYSIRPSILEARVEKGVAARAPKAA